MDALKNTIRQERSYSSPETTTQLVGHSVAVGTGAGVIFGLLTAAGLFGLHRFKSAQVARTAVMTGTVAGAAIGLPVVGWAMSGGAFPLEENSKVRDAACKVKKEDENIKDDLFDIAQKAIESVKPERLVLDLHNAVRKESGSIWRQGMIARCLGSGAIAGGLVGYMTFAWAAGLCVAKGWNPMAAVKLGMVTGAGIGLFASPAGICTRPGQLKDEPSVIEAKNRASLGSVTVDDINKFYETRDESEKSYKKQIFALFDQIKI
jgi:hypothetical protein